MLQFIFNNKAKLKCYFIVYYLLNLKEIPQGPKESLPSRTLGNKLMLKVSKRNNIKRNLFKVNNRDTRNDVNLAKNSVKVFKNISIDLFLINFVRSSPPEVFW